MTGRGDSALLTSSDEELSPVTSNDKPILKNVFQTAPVGQVAVDLPFNKRPLSDTPVNSNTTSPVWSHNGSIENSPEVIPTVIQGGVSSFKLNRRGTAVNMPGITKSHTPSPVDQNAGSKLVIVMVGLPARGKSYITNKLTRYLNWLQHDCRVFNVGNTRRKDAQSSHIGPSSGPLPDDQTEHSASFFNPENTETTKIREKWAMDTLDQLLDYLLKGQGSVGIFDATNSTISRRMKIFNKIKERNKELKILYLETVCTDKSVIESNILLKLSGPDYKNMDRELALKDFTERLHNYEKAYEPLSDEEGLQYIKMIDVGKKVVAYNIEGFLASQAIYYLLNFNLSERQIWITRHGESEDNVLGKIGGDSNLTKRGEKFARTLARFIESEKKKFNQDQLETHTNKTPSDLPNFNVWTSMLQRSVQTSKYFSSDEFDIKEIRMLNELCAGTCEGLTYEEIQSKYPHQFSARIANKLRYRYPGIGGESYLDVINRLRPIINEVERTTDHVLLITHRVVARVLLGYFMNLDRDNITSLDIPLHCAYLLEPKPYGVEWSLYEYDEERDWFYKVSKENIDHKKKVKEVEVEFRERKYSVVPTAPTRLGQHSSSTSVLGPGSLPNLGNPLNSLQRARGVSSTAQQARISSNHSQLEFEQLTDRLNKIKTSKN